jgi:hypothetical protein
MKKLKAFIARQLDRINGLNAVQQYEAECACAKKAFTRDFPEISDFFEKSVAAGCADHLYSAWKFTELHHYLETLRPSTIVEFGGGMTTCVLAKYATDNLALRNVISIDSLDENEGYQKSMMDRLPVSQRSCINFIHSPSEFSIVDGKAVCYYEKTTRSDNGLPASIDLAYVDGPVCQKDGKSVPCIDVVNLLGLGHQIKHILFDYRIDSVAYLLDSRAGHPYDFALNYLAHRRRYGTWTGSTPRHHSYFWKRA